MKSLSSCSYLTISGNPEYPLMTEDDIQEILSQLLEKKRKRKLFEDFKSDFGCRLV